MTLWEYREDQALRLRTTRENKDFLPGVAIPEGVEVLSDLRTASSEKEVLFITLPSHVVRQVSESLSGTDMGNAIMVSGTKGIENATLLRMSQVLLETAGVTEDRIVVLSGPCHAEEVARSIPTVVVAASSSKEAAKRIQEILMNPVFRVYTNEDVLGVELGGALKNVIAIAAGISDGVGFGDNTKAAIIVRGIVEITRLGTAMGANPLTFAGLSGMGDLIVTCTSRHSRNRYLGQQIGRGKSLEQVLGEMVMVVEGVKTARSASDLSHKYRIDMPMTNEVHQVLFEGKPPERAVFDLMTRDPKAEAWG